VLALIASFQLASLSWANVKATTSPTKALPAYGGLEINAGPMGGVGAVPLGNEVALNVKGGGPGKGYVQHGQAGSQGCHGTPHKGNKTPTAKPLWEGWEK